jgi:uncharacterized membrane protein YgcG
MKKPVFKLFWLLLCMLILEGCGQRQGGKTSESQTQELISYEIGDTAKKAIFLMLVFAAFVILSNTKAKHHGSRRRRRRGRRGGGGYGGSCGSSCGGGCGGGGCGGGD